MLLVTVVAVSKVIISVSIGAIASSTVPNIASSVEDFSFLISNVLLPCLTMTSIAGSIDTNLLLESAFLVLFGVFNIIIGLCCAFFISGFAFKQRPRLEQMAKAENTAGIAQRRSARDVLGGSHTYGAFSKEDIKVTLGTNSLGKACVVIRPRRKLRKMRLTADEIAALIEPPMADDESNPGYVAGTVVGCSLQNAVVIPLSLLQNVAASLPWIDLPLGSSYIFIYSIVVTIYLWSGAPLVVDWARGQSIRQRDIRTLLELHARLSGVIDACVQADFPEPVGFHHFSRRVPGRAAQRHQAEVRRPIAHQAPRGVSFSVDQDPLSCHDHQAALPLPLDDAFSLPYSAAMGTGDARVDPAVVAKEVEACGAALGGYAEQIPYNWREHEIIQVLMPEKRHKNSNRNPQSPPLATTVTGCADATAEGHRGGGIEVLRDDWSSSDDEDSEERLSFGEMYEKCREWLQRFSHSSYLIALKLLKSIPFMSVMVGITIGIVPWLRMLFFDDGWLSPLMDAASLIGKGSVPSSLLLLGISLAASSKNEKRYSLVHLRHATQNTEESPAEQSVMSEDSVEIDGMQWTILDDIGPLMPVNATEADDDVEDKGSSREISVTREVCAGRSVNRPWSTRHPRARGSISRGSSSRRSFLRQAAEVSASRSPENPLEGHMPAVANEVAGAGWLESPGMDEDIDKAEEGGGHAPSFVLTRSFREILVAEAERRIAEESQLPSSPSDSASSVDTASPESNARSHSHLVVHHRSSGVALRTKVAMRSTIREVTGHPVVAGIVAAFSLTGVRKSFVWLVIAVRLLLIPAVGFPLTLAMVKAFGIDSHRNVLVLVLLLEIATPSAINSALLFNMRSYMTREFAKMLFFQYFCCVLSVVMWGTMALALIGWASR